MKNKLSTLLIVLFSTIWNISFASDYYQRHYMIIVDQTKDMQKDEEANMKNIFSFLENNFLGENDTFEFDEVTDNISLYSFGLSGTGFDSGNGQYAAIRTKANNSENEAAYELFVKDLIYNEGSLKTDTTKDNLKKFIEEKMRPLFEKGSKKYVDLKDDGGVTFSKYVFPIILEKEHFNFTIPASKYIIIIVSNFQSGLDDLGTSQDRTNLKQMLGNSDSVLVFFDSKISSLNDYFYRIPYFEKEFLSSKFNKNAKPSAYGYELGLRRGGKVLNRFIYISSNINVIQNEYKGKTFSLSPVNINFYHDDSVKVNKVEFSITDSCNNILYSKDWTDSNIIKGYYDTLKKIYKFPAQDIEFKKEVTQNDKIKFKYVFYSEITDKGNKIIDFVDEAKLETHVIEAEAPDNMIMTWTIGGIIFGLLLAGLLYYIWRHRGKNIDLQLDFRIDKISKMRFMDVVEDNERGLHVLNYDCWYMREGETDHDIHVRGRAKLVPKVFAKKYPIRVSYKVQDLDQNFDFSFRPKGYNSDGSLMITDTYYRTILNPDGDFGFDVTAYQVATVIPDFDNRENILKLGVEIKVELIDKEGNVIKAFNLPKDQTYKTYEFIAKPRIENPDLWMAFDPGTSGSCIAYGYGGMVDTNNIHLAQNLENDAEGYQHLNKIFPSKIRILDTASAFNNLAEDIDNAQEVKDPKYATANNHHADFYFGNLAKILWGANSFQSIKKLLGYKTKLTISRKDGSSIIKQEIAGRDLAYLLIKGLLNHFEDYLLTNDEDFIRTVRPKFFPDGQFKPSRAIVTVPNNYTLTKVRDMVGSIKRTNLFKEVHYIYEAEGVMMSYIRMNWSQLSDKQHFTFVVFDMGGATINATAFRIRVNEEVRKGNTYIRDVNVSTVSKIGYCVGGDDIDYALIQILYKIPSVIEALKEKDINPRRHQQENKTQILRFIERLKIDYIDKKHNVIKRGNVTESMEIFWTNLWNEFSKWGNINLPAEPSDDDKEYISAEIKKRETLTYYVFSKVEDAVKELMSDTIKNSKIELIFSGRSSLYPGIEETVLKEIRNPKYECVCEDRWHGLDKPDLSMMDDEKVKTAVVEGACWYAMWSQHIIMDHDFVTSTFGYVDMKDNKSCFIPVICKNDPYINGIARNQVEAQTPTLQNVKFIQMLGSNYDEILSSDIRYKMNPLIEVTANEIDGEVEEIFVEVDDKNNFTYSIKVAGQGDVSGNYEAADTDILDENSEVYAFAAINPETDLSAVNQRNDGSLTGDDLNRKSDHQEEPADESGTARKSRGGGL